MPAPRSSARFAALLAVVAVLFASGVAAGAAGSALIIGSQVNNAGSADTQLITNSSVIAFKLLQNGPGTGLMGYATPASGGTRGVYGRVDSPSGDGIQARNAAGSLGTGAGLHAYGGLNHGIIAESTGSVPLKLIAPGGTAPFSTNSTTRVTNLNADQLDGWDSSALMLGLATIPSGFTITGAGAWDHAAIADNADVQFFIDLPARAPVALTNTTVNFAPFVLVLDGDVTCTGTAAGPTAPSGKLCIYIYGSANLDEAQGFDAFQSAFADRSFGIAFSTNTAVVGVDLYLRYTWAYTAP